MPLSSNSRRRSSREKSGMVAFCGVMTALSVVFMLTGGVMMIATYVAPMLAGVLLLPVMLEYGRKAAWLSFAATAILSFLIGLDKEAAFFYLFFGYWPLVKWELDKRIRNKSLLLLAKALWFALLVSLMYALIAFVFHMDAVTREFAEMGHWLTAGFMLLLVVCMLLYDRLLTPLVILYAQRLRPRLTFLGKR